MQPSLEEPILATPEEAEQLRALNQRLSADGYGCFLVDDKSDTRIPIPRPLFRILVAATRDLAMGRSVVITHRDQELTTQQAADILQVSRPYLIRLLEGGKIRYSKVGTHRRIRLGDLLRYKEIRDERRRVDLREVIRVSEALGLYDDEDKPATPTEDGKPAETK